MKAVIVGYGKMGQLVKNTVDQSDKIECVGIIKPETSDSLFDIKEKFDVIIDFSHPSSLIKIKDYVKDNPTALVLATTGYSPEDVKIIEELSKKVPVVYTANFSLGITIFQQVLKQITPVLRDAFDIEIIEKHHNLKIDSPSGTAKMLLKAVEDGKEYNEVYGREGIGKRGEKGPEIGIHAIRGGTIAGEHTVMFAGDDEILEITHQAHSKQIFATGAVRAAEFAANQKPGLYDMNDVLFEKR